jgi:nitroimidazol reductase NimA-like FMN-containing flavoprotein (pyridoxamine 5'-phosphate oxidase superfamily)
MEGLWSRGELREIGRDECLALIEGKSVGRIGYCSLRGAVVLPVNHAVIGGEIVVRIEPSGETARYLRDNAPGADLSFEVDDFDDDTLSGWSVLVTGTARAVDSESLLELTDRPVPWPAGGFWEYVRIHPHRITGRRLSPT